MAQLKITRIIVKNFRAFRGEYEINLHEGRNLLVYGENGSGKTSVFQALNYFFSSEDLPISKHKNIFVTEDAGYVKLEIGDGENPSKTFEWEETTHPSSETLIVEASKTKGFLDYRSLLQTHFVHRQAKQVNVFNLLVGNLLAHIRNPITRKPLGEEWQSLIQLSSGRRSKSREERIHQALKNFNGGLTVLLKDIEVKANEILEFFRQTINLQLNLPNGGLIFNSNQKTIENQAILLTVEYYGQPIKGHHLFLNEGRLSAIGISIYLGALLLNPPSKVRLLFLDDVFIGLDLSNRLPLLEALSQFFSEWQIFMMTYDRVWFEMMRKRVEIWNPKWDVAELFCAKSDEGDIPVYHPSKDYLAVAQQHLNNDDLRAAVIYIRSAYERELKRFCDKHNLAVRYCENIKRQKSDDFWQVVKSQKREDGDVLLDSTLVNKIELYRASILNQLSHTAPVNLVRQEVEESLQAVEEMCNILRTTERGNLQ